MRVTGGKFRGRILAAPKDKRVRPTSDKVRQAVFNMLAGRGMPEDAVVLDVFCGTGSLGIEALSRGARLCTFMDNSRESLRLCKANIASIENLERSCGLLYGNALRPPALPAGKERADLLFLDPPYGKGLIPRAIKGLKLSGWLSDICIAVCECGKYDNFTEENMKIIADKLYGDTNIIIGFISDY